MPSLSSSLTAFSNAPNDTSLADGVPNHDRSAHNGPQSDSAAAKDSLDEGKKAKGVHMDSADLKWKRSRSESRTPASSRASEASQEQPSVQYQCDKQRAAAMNEQLQKTTDLIDGKLDERLQYKTTLTTSADPHNTELLPVIRKKFPEPWMAEIVPGLFLGDVTAAKCPEMLRENNIDAIVSLCEAPWAWGWAIAMTGIQLERHIFIRCEDSPTLDLLPYMSNICDFIDRMASPALQQSSSLQLPSALPPSGSILAHCVAGRSRSPAVITAYLMRKYRLKLTEARDFAVAKRRVKPRFNLVRQLQIWEQVGYNVWEDDEKKIPKALYRAYLDVAVQIDGKRDRNAITSTGGALDALYPTRPRLERPYCCRLVGDCPCKDAPLPSLVSDLDSDWESEEISSP